MRSLQEKDLVQLRKIHEEHFAGEFIFPDFMQNNLSAFVIEEDNEIILGGMVKLITESILITDMSKPPRFRREALLRALDYSTYTNHKFNHDQLHCFVQDEQFSKQLEKYGFEPVRGKALVYG